MRLLNVVKAQPRPLRKAPDVGWLRWGSRVVFVAPQRIAASHCLAVSGGFQYHLVLLQKK